MTNRPRKPGLGLVDVSRGQHCGRLCRMHDKTHSQSVFDGGSMRYLDNETQRYQYLQPEVPEKVALEVLLWRRGCKLQQHLPLHVEISPCPLLATRSEEPRAVQLDGTVHNLQAFASGLQLSFLDLVIASFCAAPSCVGPSDEGFFLHFACLTVCRRVQRYQGA